jgi:hypothetical protein
MMNGTSPSTLQIELLSDATFSRGEGTAGVVDTEVEHDEFGMPFIGGKTIRGLLRDSWLSMHGHFPDLAAAAERVFGRSQSLDEKCRLRIGDARLPAAVRDTIRDAVGPEPGKGRLMPDVILAGFTSIRYQTAEDRETGAPEATTLRSSRVVLRGFVFESRLSWLNGYEPNPDDRRILAMCVLVTRHSGLLRNRGRGHIRMTLDGDLDRTRQYVEGKT